MYHMSPPPPPPPKDEGVLRTVRLLAVKYYQAQERNEYSRSQKIRQALETLNREFELKI